MNDVDENDESQMKLYTDTPIRCRHQLNQNRLKDCLDSATVRHEILQNSTPNGPNDSQRTWNENSDDQIVTPREFSKHLIAADQQVIQVEATEREKDKADRVLYEDLQQLMGHHTIPENNLEFDKMCQ